MTIRVMDEMEVRIGPPIPFFLTIFGQKVIVSFFFEACLPQLEAEPMVHLVWRCIPRDELSTSKLNLGSSRSANNPIAHVTLLLPQKNPFVQGGAMRACVRICDVRNNAGKKSSTVGHKMCSK